MQSLCHLFLDMLFNMCFSKDEPQKFKTKQEQDGPSLESSSYLNVSLRYLGPQDPGTLGPVDFGTI